MIELQPDFFLPAEAVKPGGVAFDLKVRNLQSDRLTGLAIVGLEKRGHAALRNHIGDLETLVEQRPDAQFTSGASLALTDGGMGRLGMIDIPYLDDRAGNVVTHLPFLRQGNQSFARFSRMVFHCRLEYFVIQDESIQPIRTLQDDVPFKQSFG